MNDSKTKLWVGIAIFIISIVLVLVGQKQIGYTGLAIEFVGLIGVLSVLYMYNRQYK